MLMLKEFQKNQWMKATLQVVGLVIYFIIGCAFYSSYEGWSINTTCFFTVVTMCTVGYGYHYPTSDSSRAFTIFYIVIGVYFAFSALVDTVKSQLDSISSYVQRISGDGTLEHRYLHHQRVFWICLSCIVAFIFIGGGVISALEGWSFITGLYFAIETSSTVGYGDLDLNYSQSKAFIAFYIVVSTTLIVILVKNYETIRKIKREILKRQSMLLKRRDLHTIAELDNGDGVTEAQFVLAVLERTGVLDHKSDISPWIEKFRSMQLNSRGKAERKAIDAFAATEAEIALQELDKMSLNSGVFVEENNPMSLSMQGISLLQKDKEDHIDF